MKSETSSDMCQTSDFAKKKKLVQSNLQERVQKVHNNSPGFFKNSLTVTLLTFTFVIHL